MIAATMLEEVSLQFEPVGSWLGVGLVTAALLAVLLAVPPDRSRVSRQQVLMLTLLRLAAFLAVVLCLVRPTFVATKKARQQGTVLVLADASESMTVADGPGGRTRWREMTDALAAARPVARGLIDEGGFDVAVWRFDREFQALAPVGDDPFPLGEWRAADSTDETAIGAALDDGLRALAGRTLAGVILLSDGAQQAYAPRDVPPQTTARRLGDMGTPLWTVTFGQQRGAGQGRDAAILNLQAAERVSVRNTLEVEGRVRLEGLAGSSAVVRLLAETDAGALEEVARTTVKAGAEAGEEPVRLAWTPKTVGERKLSLVVDRLDGEVVVANNELSTFVDVVDGGLRVLYLEGTPRFEQTRLRRALASIAEMQVDYELINSAQRRNWPVNLARTLDKEHAVYLIGDLDSAALRPEDLRTILGRVERGAGIGLLGGLHAFEAGGWGSSALGPLVPFDVDRLARQPFDEPVREGLHLKGPLRMLPHERFGDISFMRLGKTGGDSRAVWESLPPLPWANDLGRLTATARPVAVTADGRPLAVVREYGDGRVLACAADETWRWEMAGAAEQYKRFWRQVVLWLAKQDDAKEDRLWVRLAQRRISPGTPLEFNAGIVRGDGTPVADAVLEGTLEGPGEREGPSKEKRTVRLAKQGDSWAGTITDCAEPGDWRLVVKAIRLGAAGSQEKSQRFTVFRQDLELANPRANPLLMRQLAESTPGGVRQPEELAAIFTEIAERPAAFETEEQWSYTPWDKWPMFLLLAACMCGEWFLRKRWGLV
ncbi:membrane protein [Planctomycetia bacterium]|nr:membrane protein [Planctomycetia bacterium]